MSKVYEKRYTVAGGNPLVLPHSHEPFGFKIDVPPSGMVKKLLIKQADGAPIAIKVNLYNDQVVPIDPGGMSSSDPVTQMDKDLAKIIPEQSVISNTPFELFVTSEGYAYQNMEGTFSSPVRAIYLEFNGSPTTETTWEVAIAVVPSLSGE